MWFRKKQRAVDCVNEAREQLRAEVLGKLEELGFSFNSYWGSLMFNGGSLERYNGVGMEPITIDHIEKAYMLTKYSEVK